MKFLPLAAIGVTGVAGVGVTLYQIKQSYNNVLPKSSIESTSSQNEEYVYTVDPVGKTSFLQKFFLPFWPRFLTADFNSGYRYVADSRSDDPFRRTAAIQMLSEMTMTEGEYRRISQLLDDKTAAALAHCNADPRMFLAPTFEMHLSSEFFFSNKMREIFSLLPSHRVHDCLNNYINKALKNYHPAEEELVKKSTDNLTGFESELMYLHMTGRKMTEQIFLVYCLLALLSHSRVPEQQKQLVDIGTIEVLAAASFKHSNCREILYLVVKILANLSCEESAQPIIRRHGLLKKLAEWSRNEDLRLCLPAKRALHNLDREGESYVLPSGVYQLYPDVRVNNRKEEFSCDIVFVHGLWGAVFRTWRRQDQRANLQTEINDDQNENFNAKLKRVFQKLKSFENPDANVIPKNRQCFGDLSIKTDGCISVEEDFTWDSCPTQCWPRDWLPQDCKNARVIAVDFDSFVTHWFTVCPVESAERTLKNRGSELLDKLSSIGVGKRPTIFVTHSMGGILLKHMITQAEHSSKKSLQDVSKNTSGIFFFGVPHYGTNLAAVNFGGVMLPTLEVKEISDTNKLKVLERKFKPICDKYKYKIFSFGETKETHYGFGIQFKLVPFASADPGHGDFYALDCDHLNLCKPQCRNSFIYRKVVDFVQQVCRDCDDAKFEVDKNTIFKKLK